MLSRLFWSKIILFSLLHRMSPKSHFITTTKVACILFELCSPILCGLASLHSPLAIGEAQCAFVAEKSKKNDEQLSYATINYGEDSYDIVSRAFGSVRSRNFSGYMQSVPVCLNDDDTMPKRFSASLGSSSISNQIIVTNAMFYTNQEELARFETLCINVYQKNWSSLNSAQFGDGFVFLPDYYADSIIASSNDLMSYDDLLPFPSSAGEFISKKYLCVQTSLGERRWSIVGIYHCNGFSAMNLRGENVLYNDLNFGKALNALGAPAVIAFDSSFSAKHLNGILTCSQPKSYILDQNMRKLSAFDKETVAKSSFFEVSDGQINEMENSSIIYTKNHFFVCPPSIFLVIFLAASCACTIGFFVTGKKIVETCTANKFRWLFLLPIFCIGLLSSLFKNWLGLKIIGISIFSSFYFGISLLILLILSVFLIAQKQKSGDGYVQTQ